MKSHSDAEILFQLRQFPLLESVPETSLQWLAQKSVYHELKKDELLFDKDEEVIDMIILLNGKSQTFHTKKTDFSELTDEFIKQVEDILNNRPRKRYNYG
jgi:hypothetical protein